MRAWFHSRVPPTDHLALTQRNVYILPTRPGWMMLVTLGVMLVGSINYQLNLGYLLTFLLAGSAAASIHYGHGNLRGLTIKLSPVQPTHVGAPVHLDVTLDSGKTGARFGICVSVSGASDEVWVDVPAQGSIQTQVGWIPPGRGRHHLPVVQFETRYPLGLFRVWAIWRPASQAWVYPQPEHSAPPLPVGHTQAGKGRAIAAHQEGYDGLRSYRRGDPLKAVVWKRVAQAMARGSADLVSRDVTPVRQSATLWLDARQTSLPAKEHQLSRLAAWILRAETENLVYGLKVDGRVIPPSQGPAHRQRCLEVLALC